MFSIRKKYKQVMNPDTPDMSAMMHELQRFFRIVDGANHPAHILTAERWLVLMSHKWGLYSTTGGIETGRENMLIAASQYLDNKRAEILRDYVFDDSQLLKEYNDARFTEQEESTERQAGDTIWQRIAKSFGFQIRGATVVETV